MGEEIISPRFSFNFEDNLDHQTGKAPFRAACRGFLCHRLPEVVVFPVTSETLINPINNSTIGPEPVDNKK